MHKERLGIIYKFLFVSCIFQQIGKRYASDGQKCRVGFRSNSSKTCLQINQEPTIWYDAKKKCKDDGGTLVKILDTAMNTLIGTQMKDMGENMAWIGLVKDPALRQEWFWTRDLSTVNFDRLLNTSQDFNYKTCAMFMSFQYVDHVWQEHQCFAWLPFICELDLEQTTPIKGTKRNDTGKISTASTQERSKASFTECPEDTYGRNCSQTCSVNCRKSENQTSCSGENGFCLDGCKDGYMGRLCVEVCPYYLYGEYCLQFCSENCARGTPRCNPMNGFCSQGCLPGFTGKRCDKALAEMISTRKVGKMKIHTFILLSVLAVWLLIVLWAGLNFENRRPKQMLRKKATAPQKRGTSSDEDLTTNPDGETKFNDGLDKDEQAQSHSLISETIPFKAGSEQAISERKTTSGIL